ncbi:hypothetical protein REPUB_Repub14bG0067700 [Reevesia pubescens]
MEGRLFCFLLALQIVSWTSATSRPLAPNDGFGVHQPVTGGQSLQSLQNFESKKGTAATKKLEADVEGESKLGIGSNPPSCEHKCYGCIPCEAIQVPTTSKRSHVGLQYTNYEPESWKCKCGPSFYSP